MKRAIITTLCLMIVFTSIQAKTLTIQKCITAPTIDGNGDVDWTGIAWQSMSQHKGEAVYKNNIAKFKMTYDNDFLYLFTSVEDVILDTAQSANIWEKDGISVYISLDTTSQYSTNGKNGFIQLFKVYGRDIYYYGYTKGSTASEEATAGGFTQEWKLSWDSIAQTLTSTASWNGKDLRFEILNDDNDGAGRNSLLFWNSNTDDQWNSTKNMGYITLATPISTTNPSMIGNNKNLTISKCTAAPTIDGNGDDWANVAWQAMDQHKGEAANKNNTAKFKITYTVSPAMVYVFASVEDATLDTVQSANVWEKDCIELFFAMDTANTTTTYRTGDIQLRKVFGRDMDNYFMSFQKGFKAIDEFTASGFTQEWALSIDSLCSDGKGGPKANFNGKNFRFEITNSDNDGSGRMSQIFWNSNADDQWYCNNNMGYITLNEPIDVTTNYLTISSSTFSIGNSSITKYVNISSNTSWTAYSNQSWLTLSSYSGSGDKSLYLYASANTLTASRVAYVTITTGNITRTITVTQSGSGECISQTEYNRVVAELIAANDSINTLLEKFANNITVTVINMKDYTAIVSLSGTNVYLKLFPNPSKDKIQVECSSPISQVEVYDLEGKQVYNRLSSGTESFITIEGFEEGIYLLKVHTDKGIAGGKFAITK